MTRVTTFLLLSLSIATPALAQDVGSVASVSGTAEIGRGGTWTPAEAGAGVQLGDGLRTGDGRMRVVFQDDSVLNLGENTNLTVDEQVFQPDQGTFRSMMKLLRGKVRATVGSYYQKPGAEYDVETPTAVAGVRGTTFLVSYDEAAQTTEVLGINGRVHVRGLNERVGEGVYVTAYETTAVGADGRATRPERLDEELYRQRLENLEILSGRGIGGVASGAAVQGGGAVAAPDRAPLAGSSTNPTTVDDNRNASDVVGQPIPVVETGRGKLGVPF